MTRNIVLIPTAINNAETATLVAILEQKDLKLRWEGIVEMEFVGGQLKRQSRQAKSNAMTAVVDMIKKELAERAKKEEKMKSINEKRMEELAELKAGMAPPVQAHWGEIEAIVTRKGLDVLKSPKSGSLYRSMNGIRKRAESLEDVADYLPPELEAALTDEQVKEVTHGVAAEAELPHETILQYVLRAWSASLNTLRKAFPEMNIGWDDAAKRAQNTCVTLAQGAKTLQDEQEVELHTVATIEEHQDRLQAVLEAMEERNKQVSQGKKSLESVGEEPKEEQTVTDNESAPEVQEEAKVETVSNNEETVVETEEANVGKEQAVSNDNESTPEVQEESEMTEREQAIKVLSIPPFPEGMKGKDFMKCITKMRQDNPQFWYFVMERCAMDLNQMKQFKAMKENPEAKFKGTALNKMKKWNREDIERVWRLATDRYIAEAKEEAQKRMETEEQEAKEATHEQVVEGLKAARAAGMKANAQFAKKDTPEEVEEEPVKKPIKDMSNEELEQVEAKLDKVIEELEAKEASEKEETVSDNKETPEGEKKESVVGKMKKVGGVVKDKIVAAAKYPRRRLEALQARERAWGRLDDTKRKELKEFLSQLKKDRKGRETGFDPASASAKELAALVGKLANAGWHRSALTHLEEVKLALLTSSFVDENSSVEDFSTKLKEQKVAREGQGEGYILNPENPNYEDNLHELWALALHFQRYYKAYERKLPSKIQAKGETWLWNIVTMAEQAVIAAGSPFVGVAMALWNLAAVPVAAVRAKKGERKEAAKDRVGRAFGHVVVGLLRTVGECAYMATTALENKVEAVGAIVGGVVGAMTGGLMATGIGAVVGGILGNVARDVFGWVKGWFSGRKAKKAETKVEATVGGEAVSAAAC